MRIEHEKSHGKYFRAQMYMEKMKMLKEKNHKIAMAAHKKLAEECLDESQSRTTEKSEDDKKETDETVCIDLSDDD